MYPVLDKESVDLKVLAYKIKENLIQKYFASLQYRTEEEKSRIRETPNLSTNADHRTDTSKNIIIIFFFLNKLVKIVG